MSKQVVLSYEPREQFKALHNRKERFACMICHRRAGKTVAAVNELVIRALHSKKHNPRYAYIAPFFSQAKEIAWVYLKDAVKDFAVKIRESSLRVELPNGAWITLYGSDNPDRIRGIFLDGCVIDEYGDCRPSLWGEILRPCIADRKGWAIFLGTPKGKNHFYKIHQISQRENDWFSLTLKASETGILDKEELDGMRSQMTEEEYDQEMEVSFTAALRGTYYAELISKMERAGRIQPKVVQYDPSLPVKAAMDLGRTDSTATWFWQEAANGFNVIDYHEAQGEHLDFYIEMFREKGYRYEEIWVPHDAVAKTLATKRSTIEQMLDAGFPCRKVPRLARQHGIDAVRLVLPSCFIDQEKCFSGVEALRAYARKFDPLSKSYSKDPLHNWASDGADAFRYFALVAKEKVINTNPSDLMFSNGEIQRVNPYSLDDLYMEREARNRFNKASDRI